MSRPARLRGLAAAFLCAFLIGNLGGLIHAATTVHTRCAEHGELVDGAAPQGAEPADRDREDSGSIARRSRAGDPADHHGHCLIGCAAHEKSTLALRASPAALLVATARPLHGLDRPARLYGRELYRTAPKASPPAT